MAGRSRSDRSLSLDEAWAEALDFLEENGVEDPTSLTPPQAVARLHLADKRHRRRLMENYAITRAAQHADKKADEKLRKELGGG